MPSTSRTIYYLEKTEGFAEPISTDLVLQIDPTVVIFKGAYLSQPTTASDSLERGKQELRHHPCQTLLRPLPSSDGPPYWSALVYMRVKTGTDTIRVRYKDASHRGYDDEFNDEAVCYHANPPGSYAWETDVDSGKAGYFLTGASGPSALWRIIRIQADALNRQILTFAPVQLAPSLATPTFDDVPPQLREHLALHFEGFQQALSHNASFDAIDRANNLTEGILSYCLSTIGATPSKSLDGMLSTAKGILEDKQKQKDFLLTYYAYNLAQVIRQLHARLHHNQAVDKGKTVRPEVGLNLSVTVSELLVEVGLGKY